MNIMPNKTIREDFSLLGIGAILLSLLSQTDTVSSIWERAKVLKQINTYEKFISGLSLLFIMGIIEYKDGVITRK